jgi:hypothetical protein
MVSIIVSRGKDKDTFRRRFSEFGSSMTFPIITYCIMLHPHLAATIWQGPTILANHGNQEYVL